VPQRGIALTPYSPNARGFLAGNTRPDGATLRGSTDKMTRVMRLGVDEEDMVIADRVAQVAPKARRRAGDRRAGLGARQARITSPIVGATKMPHLDDAMQALEITLDAENRELSRSAVSRQTSRGPRVTQDEVGPDCRTAKD